jgi:endogenous inhibitor of DNA gyrase (YacG/DUF329 family)
MATRPRRDHDAAAPQAPEGQAPRAAAKSITEHRCPICGSKARPRRGDPPNPAFPFCSGPCKLVDLGRWLDGGYRVEGPPVESTSLDAGPPEGEGDE